MNVALPWFVCLNRWSITKRSTGHGCMGSISSTCWWKNSITVGRKVPDWHVWNWKQIRVKSICSVNGRWVPVPSLKFLKRCRPTSRIWPGSNCTMLGLPSVHCPLRGKYTWDICVIRPPENPAYPMSIHFSEGTTGGRRTLPFAVTSTWQMWTKCLPVSLPSDNIRVSMPILISCSNRWGTDSTGKWNDCSIRPRPKDWPVWAWRIILRIIWILQTCCVHRARNGMEDMWCADWPEAERALRCATRGGSARNVRWFRLHSMFR